MIGHEFVLLIDLPFILIHANQNVIARIKYLGFIFYLLNVLVVPSKKIILKARTTVVEVLAQNFISSQKLIEEL